MSNEEILNKRWLKTDKVLKSYLKEFNSLSKDTIDELIEVFNSLDITYNDLNKTISKAEKRKLDKKIKEWKKQGILVGYFAYLISSKNKITYADLLEILIYAIYVNQAEEIKNLSKEIFTLVAEDIYLQAMDERKKKKKFSFTWEYIWSLLWIPTYNKNWDSYLQLLTLTNEQEMYKQLLTIIQQEKLINENMLRDLIKKQMNRIISINDDKYSGVLSDTCRQLGNKIYIEPFKEEKNLQIRFIAEMDKRTTKMCSGMNNMLFYVNDWNKFYRYSDIDGRDVLYTVKGLEQGINLPPINNHFHWCRSTITYQLDIVDINRNYRDVSKYWISKSIVNRNAKVIVPEKNDRFIYNGEEYIIDGKKVVLDYNTSEYKLAEWLSKKINKKITMVPRINYPFNIKTPDYKIKNMFFDLKTINGNSNQALYHAIRNKNMQSENFIFDITNSALTMADTIEQVKTIYSRKDTQWVEIIMIKKDNNLFVYKKKE